MRAKMFNISHNVCHKVSCCTFISALNRCSGLYPNRSCLTVLLSCFLFLTFHRDLQMKITWLSTNTNMRWPWSLAQQGTTVSSLLVSSPEVYIFECNWYFTWKWLYWRFSSITDQTPTPTRFLKNCEEVGLFNELASPFDHDFKKATEDDIKKVVVVELCQQIICLSHLKHLYPCCVLLRWFILYLL